MYDAIVVGARCAGSPAAMLLARKGYRVLLVDRATFPSETLSTHVLWPMGCTYLNRWGLLDPVLACTPSWRGFSGTIEGIPLCGSPSDQATRSRLRSLHGDDAGVVDVFTVPRRRILDALLRNAAEAAGAEVREGFVVDGLIQEDGRVVGIVGLDQSGARVTERARVVVGADGRHSSLGRATGAPTLRARSKCTFSYWSYWSGLSLDGLDLPLHQRGRFKIAAAPTNDGLAMVLAFGPTRWFRDFRKDVEGNFLKVMDFVCPALAERLRGGARREERIYGTADQPNYHRQAAGPGWALVGDAAYMKDQCTAIGMTHAFRSAEILASRLDEARGGAPPLDEALADYARVHAELAEGYLDFIAGQAEMNAASRDELGLCVAMRQNQPAIDGFIGAFGDVVLPGEFFAPDNLGAILGEARESTEDYPIFRDYDSRAREYAVNPFTS